MKQILTSFAVVATGEGRRVSYTYSVLDDAGNVQQSNVRRSFIATTDALNESIHAVEAELNERLKLM